MPGSLDTFFRQKDCEENSGPFGVLGHGFATLVPPWFGAPFAEIALATETAPIKHVELGRSYGFGYPTGFSFPSFPTLPIHSTRRSNVFGAPRGRFANSRRKTQIGSLGRCSSPIWRARAPPGLFPREGQ